MRGSLAGYASPGADIDAGLDAPLTVRLKGVSYQDKRTDAGNLEGGRPPGFGPFDLVAWSLKLTRATSGSRWLATTLDLR